MRPITVQRRTRPPPSYYSQVRQFFVEQKGRFATRCALDGAGADPNAEMRAMPPSEFLRSLLSRATNELTVGDVAAYVTHPATAWLISVGAHRRCARGACFLTCPSLPCAECGDNALFCDSLISPQSHAFTICRRTTRARRPKEALRSRCARSYRYLAMVSVQGFTPPRPI